MNVELVTTSGRLEHFYQGWEALSDAAGEPRSGAALVTAWARHMRDDHQELRVWVATDAGQVIGVAPLVAEPMPRQKAKLGPPATNLVRGIIPLALPERASEVASLMARHMAGSMDGTELVRLDWLPEGSPWPAALATQLGDDRWAPVDVPGYHSLYIDAAKGSADWLQRRSPRFRSALRRRTRRAEEAGYRFFVTSAPEEIVARLPAVQALYHHRGEARGGGYQFDERMMATMTEAVAFARPGRFRLATLEGGGATIGMLLSICAGPVVSSWLTAFDESWSRFGPGIGTLVAEVEACEAGGQGTVDLGVGDEAYKLSMADGTRSLRSCLWARPRLARIMQGGAGAAAPAGRASPSPG